MRKDSIPQNLLELFQKKFPEEKILFSCESDFNSHGHFAEEWVIVSRDNFRIAARMRNEYEFTFELPLKSVTEIKTVSIVDGGTLEVKTKDHTYRPVVYSNSRDVEFSSLTKAVETLIKEGRVLGEEQLHKRKYCPFCGLPIPQGTDLCPRCINKGGTLVRLLHISRKHFGNITMVFILSTVVTAFGLATPWISGKVIINKILLPMKNAHLLGPAALALLLAYAGQVFAGGWRSRVSGIVGNRVGYDVRGILYQRLQELSLSFHDKKQTGALMARVNQDSAELQRFIVDWAPIMLESVLTLIGVGIFLFFLSWKLTLLVIFPIIGAAFFLKRVFPNIINYFRAFFESRSRLSALVNDTLSGIRVVKAFGQEKLETDRFNNRSGNLREAGIKLAKKFSIYIPFVHFLIMSGTVIVWFAGGRLCFKGEMLLGDIVAYAGYVAMFYRPVFMFTRLTEPVSRSLSAAGRIFEVIDAEPEIKDEPDAVPVRELKGEVELKNVTFGYDKFRPVMKKLSIKIVPGEMLGLVGKSGAGKTTTINLILRLYDVDDGEILFDGINVKKIRYHDLRRQIGIVLQDTFLFNGTIAENISYAKPEASAEEIIRAAKAANAHEFILKKPDCYDTNVGERGVHLSPGERQRIAVARSILHNPRILILDEATSSVDTETEKKIQEALRRLTRGRTTIAIAHRLSTLRNCDRLLVLEDGKPAELGTHEELIKEKGLFYRLAQMQKELSQLTEVGG